MIDANRYLCSLVVCLLKMANGFTPSSSDTGKGRCKLPNNKVIHGFHLVKGKTRHDMEDYHVTEYRHLKDHDLGIFAIFDGHLGHGVPCYLQSNLFDNILNEVGMKCSCPGWSSQIFLAFLQDFVLHFNCFYKF
jgi:hypothetical protein